MSSVAHSSISDWATREHVNYLIDSSRMLRSDRQMTPLFGLDFFVGVKISLFLEIIARVLLGEGANNENCQSMRNNCRLCFVLLIMSASN